MRPAAIALAFGVLVSMTLASCSFFPCFERRHASGLLITCEDRVPDMPSELRDAGALAWSLADEHPDAFGYPWSDPSTGEVEIRVTGPEAEPFIQQWLAGNATRGSGEKTLPIPPPKVPLRRVATDRSLHALIDLQHGLLPPRGLPDGDLIYQAGPDLRRNVVMVWIDHESDPLLRALAATYGTAALVIRLAPNPHFRSL